MPNPRTNTKIKANRHHNLTLGVMKTWLVKLQNGERTMVTCTREQVYAEALAKTGWTPQTNGEQPPMMETLVAIAPPKVAPLPSFKARPWSKTDPRKHPVS